MKQNMIIPECLTQEGKHKEEKRKCTIKMAAGVLAILVLGVMVINAVISLK